MTETLPELVASLSSWGNRKAIGFRAEYGIRWWTYERLQRNILHAAWILKERGIEPGSRAMIWSENYPEWIAFFLGAALRGITVVPVDAAIPASKVAELAREMGISLLICESQRERRGIAVDWQELFSFQEERFLSGAARKQLEVAVKPSDPAVVLFTSGVSGEPRGVILTHGNLLHQANRFAHWRRPSRLAAVRLLALSPLSHVQGLMLGALVPFSLGFGVIQTHVITPPHLIRTIRDNRVFILSAVPRVLELLEAGLVHVRRQMGWRFLILLTGGATLPKARETFWRRAGCILIQGYGTTETTAIVSVNRPLAGRLASIGRPMHDRSVILAEDGEILVRGAHLSPGYVEGPLDLTPDGYYRTGDLASRDAHGRLFFLGRKKNLIVTGEGYNVNPQIVESALRDVAGVRDALVFGRDRDGMEEVHAVLLLAPGTVPSAAMQEANERLLPYQRARNWSVWPSDDFPRAVLGKVARAEVIAATVRDLNVTSTATEGPVSLEDIRTEADRQLRMDKTVRYVVQTASARNVRAALEVVRDVNLESIEIVQLLTRLEAEWQVPLDRRPPMEDGDAAGVETLGPEPEPEKWYHSLGWNPMRRIARRLLLRPFMRLRVRMEVTGAERLRDVEPPFVLALEYNRRRHFMDYLALYHALPTRLSKKLFMAAGLLGVEPRADLWGGPKMTLVWMMPCFFPFASIPPFGATMSGMFRVCEWMDRGYNPTMTWRPGSALVAAQMQAAVIPVHFDAGYFDRGDRRRPTLKVTFGEAVRGRAELQAMHLYRTVLDRFRGFHG